MSGGEQQKVNLGRALILPQRLLLLDEPTAWLGAGARAALIRGLADLKTAGVADQIDRENELTAKEVFGDVVV